MRGIEECEQFDGLVRGSKGFIRFLRVGNIGIKIMGEGPPHHPYVFGVFTPFIEQLPGGGELKEWQLLLLSQ